MLGKQKGVELFIPASDMNVIKIAERRIMQIVNTSAQYNHRPKKDPNPKKTILKTIHLINNKQRTLYHEIDE